MNEWNGIFLFAYKLKLYSWLIEHDFISWWFVNRWGSFGSVVEWVSSNQKVGVLLLQSHDKVAHWAGDDHVNCKTDGSPARIVCMQRDQKYGTQNFQIYYMWIIISYLNKNELVGSNARILVGFKKLPWNSEFTQLFCFYCLARRIIWAF